MKRGARTAQRRGSREPAPPLEPSAACPVLVPARATGSERRELEAWLQLQAAFFLEPAAAAGLLARTPRPAAALASSGKPPPLGRTELDARLAVLGALRTHAVPVLSPSYPERLRVLADPAPLLLVRGDPLALSERGVAIVGARAPTRYGLEVARDLARGLARAGVVVVSGLARGIDAAAHRAALEGGGKTIAFSACGPDRIYPAEHRSLADAITRSGALVTEMPPGTPPRPPYFPLRNRLIAGLAEVVVVVEARLRSGSLVTARLALDQGRDVMAVPGPITAATSEGPNVLLRDGAAPVLGLEDVLGTLGIDAEEVDAQVGDGAPLPAEGTRAAALLVSLASAPASRDELCARLSLGAKDVAAELLELELAGHVRLDRDGRLHAVRAR